MFQRLDNVGVNVSGLYILTGVLVFLVVVYYYTLLVCLFK